VKRGKPLSPKALTAVIVAGALVVVAAGAFLLVMPQRHKASDLASQVDATRAQIANARAQAASRPARTVHVTSLFKLAEAMPDHADMPGVLLQLEKAAAAAGVSIASIQPGTAQPGTTSTIQPFTVTLDADYGSVTRFLARLRGLVGVRHGKLDARGRLFTVTSVDLGTGERPFPALSAKLGLNAFVYAPSAGGAATPTAPTSTPATTTPETPAPQTPDASAAAAGANG
jgi:Pilus assembly protein, PilO